MARTLYKQPSESRVYAMNFSSELASGETITSITSVTAVPSGLTIGTPIVSVDGKKALFRLSVGDIGESYRVIVVIVTSDSNIIEGDGILVMET